MSSSSRRRFRLGVLAPVVVAVSLAAGCGTRLEDRDIAAAIAADTPGPSRETVTGNPAEETAVRDAAAVRGTGQTAGDATGAATGDTATSTGPGTTAAQPGKAATSTGQLAPAGAAPAVTRTSPRSTVVFGNIGSYSGVFGAAEEGNKFGLAAWVAGQNARGGLDGHPIKLIIADDGADPATGLATAKRMVESDKIIAFAGNLLTFSYQQLSDYAKSKGVPFIGGDGIDPGWYRDTTSFPVSPPFTNGMEAGLQYFVNQGATRLAMVYCVEVAKLCTYANDVVRKSAVGKYLVANEQVSMVAPSYTSQCLRLQSAKVEAIYALLDTAALARFASNCATQGYKPNIVALSLSATGDYPKIEALQGSYIPGATVSPSQVQVPAVAEFLAGMAKYSPGAGIGGVAMLGWANGLLLGKAGAKLSDNPTANEFVENLWKIKGETFGGFTVPLTFPKGKVAVASTCIFIWGVADQKFTAPQGAKPSC